MKYIIIFLCLAALVTCLIAGCSPYRSKSKIYEPSEQPFVEYGYDDFKESNALNEVHRSERDEPSVYQVKYVHIVV